MTKAEFPLFYPMVIKLECVMINGGREHSLIYMIHYIVIKKIVDTTESSTLES